MWRSKRLRIVVSNIVLGLMLFVLNFVNESWKYHYLILLSVVSYFLIYWSFKEYLYGIKLINLFVLPITLVASIGILLIQVEMKWWLRGVLAVVFILINYVITLSENIFNVSEVRNIPLLRAAHTVSYLATLGVSFLGFFLIYNSHLNIVVTTLLVFVLSFLIYLQALWQIDLEENISLNIILSSLASTLMTAQVGFILSFWTLKPLSAGLALTTFVYIFLGLIQHQIKEDLSRRTIVEYVFLGLSVFILLLVTMNW